MIEKMKKLQIIARSEAKENLLQGLRDLGIVHLSEKANPDKACTERFDTLSRLALTLQEYEVDQKAEILSDDEFEVLFRKVTETIDNRKELESRRNSLHSLSEKIRPWGDFLPNDVLLLKDQGIPFSFYRVDKKILADIKENADIRYITLSPVDGMPTIAVLGKLPDGYTATEFVLPEAGLGQLENEILDCNKKLAECEDILGSAAAYLKSFQAQMLIAQNATEYSAVSNTVADEEELIWLQGYVPEEQIERFKKAASLNGWAWATDDPDDNDEQVPTKVKYTKITRLMIPIFDILGIVPGYREYDISFWFLGFFTLFFAMIIGDAGYGFIFLLGAIALTVKNKKLDDTTLLIWVLSIATIIWGSLTGTWFGAEGAMNIPLLRSLVIPGFANYSSAFGVETAVQQNNIMKFCFILGTVQLTLACIMNIRRKLKAKDLSMVADIGWLLAIDALYFVVLYLVIGEDIPLKSAAAVVIVGFLLVLFFGGMSPDKTFAQGLKSGFGNAFTVFLDTISAFGNIMSYIRLFAVGMASLAIAQSFNNMTSGFKGPLVIAGIIIIIIGHGLNLVMGLLSVVVHGVRLNLLEFSGQLGMEWAGNAYNPFHKLDKIKK